MEHRRSSRKQLREHVTLDSPRIGSMLADMRDVSLGGMFVETDMRSLLPSAPVAVSFSVPHNAGRQAFHLNAVVVRREPSGVGLMFLRMGAEQIRSLSDALSRYKATESPPN